MKILSLLLSVLPNRLEHLAAELAVLPGVQVHQTLPGCKLVVTIEDVPGQDLMPTLSAVQTAAGVLCSTLTYEYCDEALSAEERT